MKLEDNKVNLKTFLAHVCVYEGVVRKIKINHDDLVNRVTAAENFSDKYIPIVAQNVSFPTLTTLGGL